MGHIVRYIGVICYLPRNIWFLREKTKKCGLDSSAGFAYRIRMRLYGSWIDPNASFQGIPCFPHGVAGIFIGGGTTIGKDCVIFQHVTIGSNMLNNSSKQGAPTLGNECYVGSGAQIIGAVVIGDSCRIGANTTVYADVPSNSTVVNAGGMRIISHENPQDNRFWRISHEGKREYFTNGRFRNDTK